MEHSIGELPSRGEKVWYLIKQDAHEGPYSIGELEERLVAGELTSAAMVWARGWPEPLAIGRVIQAYKSSILSQPMEQITPVSAVIVEEVLYQDVEPTPEEMEAKRPMPPMRWTLYLGAAALLVFGLFLWHTLKPQIEIDRPSDMDIAHFREMRADFARLTRNAPVPHLTIARDFSKIWMLDRTLQSCAYSATFSSRAEENLGGQAVSFQSQGTSAQHWVVFERFSFIEGQKILPGRYQFELERSDCRPVGIAGWWQRPDASMSLSLSIDLYTGAPEELRARLAAVAKKKEQEEQRKFEASRQAWRDIEEKFRTLAAIAAQIEQNFKGLLDRRLAWDPRMKRVIDAYTLRYGGFLTTFTVKNDEDFNQLALQELPDKVEIMGRQPMINAHAKRIGFLSMGLIEKLQKDKKAPNRRDLQDWLMALEQDFGVEKDKLRRAAEEAQAVEVRTTAPAPSSN